MREKVGIKFLEPARELLKMIDPKVRKKLIVNIYRAMAVNDPRLFKKLTAELWEFRARWNGMQYRVIAFWDRQGAEKTLVVCSHGFVKKTDKVPPAEINRARMIMNNYFLNE